VTRLEDHPLPALLRAGVRCTISTDSRTVAGTTLTREYELAAGVLRMSEEELRACDRIAREASFAR
jgi:adenosine deaminase